MAGHKNGHQNNKLREMYEESEPVTFGCSRAGESGMSA